MKLPLRFILLLLLALSGLVVMAGCQASNPTPGAQPVAGPLGAAPEMAQAAPTLLAQTGQPETAAPTLSPPTALPSATTAPAASLRPLSQDGCCVAPFWSPDSQRVLFINRPAPDGPAGIWALDLQGGAARLFSERVALYSPDMQLIAYPSNGRTYVERPVDGRRWLIPSAGHAVSFSPDSFLVTWTISTDGPFDQAQRAIWVSQFDGSQARRLDAPTGGSFSAWFPDGRMLISARLDEPQSGLILWALAPQEESAAASEPQAHKLLEITTDGRLRGFSLSPDGRWLVYMLTFASDPAQNGLWLADLQNPESSAARRLEVFGAYQWRDAGRLLVIPQEPGAPAQRLLQIEAVSGAVSALTEPGILSFKIANGDWRVSPDGRHIVYVSAVDHNLWLITLPEG